METSHPTLHVGSMRPHGGYMALVKGYAIGMRAHSARIPWLEDHAACMRLHGFLGFVSLTSSVPGGSHASAQVLACPETIKILS